MFDGTTQIRTKQGLHHALKTVNSGVLPIHASYQSGLRGAMEKKLQPWVIAHPTAFSELSAYALIFVNMMPVSTEYSVMSKHITN